MNLLSVKMLNAGAAYKDKTIVFEDQSFLRDLPTEYHTVADCMMWVLNEYPHRTTGPAIIRKNQAGLVHEFWLDGVFISWFSLKNANSIWEAEAKQKFEQAKLERGYP